MGIINIFAGAYLSILYQVAHSLIQEWEVIFFPNPLLYGEISHLYYSNMWMPVFGIRWEILIWKKEKEFHHKIMIFGHYIDEKRC